MGVIRVRFILCGGFTSRAIARVTGSLFSHVEFGTPEGNWIGAHVGGGVQERGPDYCKPIREYVYEIPCTLDQECEALAWMRSQVGTKYNVLDVVGLLFQARSANSPNKAICSEFCTLGLLHIFGAAKVLNTLAKWAYRITPETLHLSPLFVGHLVRKAG